MFIETTINIDCDVLQKLEEISSMYGFSKSNLISMVLLEMMNHDCKMPQLFKRVKYQKKTDTCKWHCLHVSFRCDVYEKAIDCRKLFKSSVSRLVSLAIVMHLEKIVQNLLNENCTDNYTSHYIFFAEISERIERVTIYYDYPGEEKLVKYLKNNIE